MAGGEINCFDLCLRQRYAAAAQTCYNQRPTLHKIQILNLQNPSAEPVHQYPYLVSLGAEELHN